MTAKVEEARPILVLGGTGQTGRRVVERLTARGIPTRIGVPSGEPPFDWEDLSTWPAVLEGVEAASVTYYPDLAFRGASEQVRASHDFSDDALAVAAANLLRAGS